MSVQGKTALHMFIELFYSSFCVEEKLYYMLEGRSSLGETCDVMMDRSKCFHEFVKFRVGECYFPVQYSLAKWYPAFYGIIPPYLFSDFVPFSNHHETFQFSFHLGCFSPY